MGVLVYGQLACLSPARAVGPIVAAVLRCVAPWLTVTEPSCNGVWKMCIAITIGVKMLAAQQVAELRRRIWLGFDKSFKFQQVDCKITRFVGRLVTGEAVVV
eukprot:6208765-Pleurochrysis_carterae.AAC.1